MGSYHKDIIGIREIPSNSEQLEQIIELSVDIPTDRHGRVDRLDITFLHQQFFDHFAEALEVRFREVMAAADGLEPLIWTTGHLSQKGGGSQHLRW